MEQYDSSDDTDFVIRHLERRTVMDRREKRNDDGHCPPCTPLAVMAAHIEAIETDLSNVKKGAIGHDKQMSAQIKDMSDQIYELQTDFAKQKSFYAGVAWVASGLVGILMAFSGYFNAGR